jgi:hypothetical protein
MDRTFVAKTNESERGLSDPGLPTKRRLVTFNKPDHHAGLHHLRQAFKLWQGIPDLIVIETPVKLVQVQSSLFQQTMLTRERSDATSIQDPAACTAQAINGNSRSLHCKMHVLNRAVGMLHCLNFTIDWWSVTRPQTVQRGAVMRRTS